jgi:hypothetical protein
MDWGVFWSVFVVMFIVLPLVFIWGFAIVDLFTRPDLSGLAKVVWLLFIIFLPVLGTLFYFIFRPTVAVDQTPEIASAHAGYVADKLTQLTDLKEKGVISQAEYDKQRSRVLALET